MFRRSPKIFISYRRDDSAVHARALYGKLIAAFGAKRVFFDVEDIDYGDAFAQVIDTRIAACDVVLAVIGPSWLSVPGKDGQPRIQSPRDYVRHEIAAALRQRKRLVPVLVGGAQMPGATSLPQDVAALAGLNAQSLSDREIGEGADRLVDVIRGERAGSIWIGALRRALAHRVGVVAGTAMAAAAWVGLFDFFALDTKTASATLWLADLAMPVPPAAELQLVVIDADTERALGKRFRRNPQTRRDHAALIQRLAHAGARSVAFDIFITTPSEADDAVLVAAIRAARAKKTAVVFGADGFEAGQPNMVPALRSAVTTSAMLCYGERLGYASSVPLLSQPASPAGAESRARAMGLALAAAYAGTAKISEGARKVIVSGDAGLREFGYSELERVREAQRCQAGLVGDVVASAVYRSVQKAALNDAGRRLKYEALGALDDVALRERFRGKTVLVGLQMTGEDEFATFHGWRSETRHGLELHADATSALLSGAVVQRPGFAATVLLTTAFGLLGSRLSQWRPGGRAWPRRALLPIIVCIALAAAVWLCAAYALLVNLTYPVGALLIGFAVAARLDPVR